jgi:hypothetical protein
VIRLVVPLRTKVGDAMVVAIGAYLDEGNRTAMLQIRERPGGNRRVITIRAGDRVAISGKDWIVDSIKVAPSPGSHAPFGISENEVVIRELGAPR